MAKMTSREVAAQVELDYTLLTDGRECHDTLIAISGEPYA